MPQMKNVSCLAISSTLKMEATCSTEISVDFQCTTWHYIQDDITLNNNAIEETGSSNNASGLY
jgi:hypothetical protein